MVTTSPLPTKDETRSSCHRNGPLPLYPNRTQPFPLSLSSSARQVGVGWIIDRPVSVLNLGGFLSLRPFGFKCAGIRIGPRLSPPPRQQIPKGARLKAADAGTWWLLAGPDLGSEHPKGLARAVLKAEAYRLRPEGLPLEEIQHDLRRFY